MVVRTVQMYDSAVTTEKIAADTIIPADVNETQAYNFSSTSGTFAGALTQMQSGLLVDVGTSSSVRSFPRAFAATPQLVASRIGSATSSANPYVVANSASSFTIYGDAGTISWIAHRNL